MIKSPESQTFIQDKQMMEVDFNEQAKMVCTCRFLYNKTFESRENFKRAEIIGIVRCSDEIVKSDFHENINKHNVHLQI